MLIEKCGICGKLAAALYLCRLCKRRVCEEHFRLQEGICSLCYSRLSVATQATETLMSVTPFKLFLLGFLLMLVGVLVLVIAALFKGEAAFSGAVTIILGPIPIIIGVGPYAFFTILLAVLLTIISFVLFFWVRKQALESEG